MPESRRTVVRRSVDPHMISGVLYKQRKMYFVNVVDLKSGEILHWYEFSAQAEWKKKVAEVQCWIRQFKGEGVQ